MPGCGSCSRKARPTGFGQVKADQTESQARAVRNLPTPLNGAQQQAKESGSTRQSFALLDTSGRVQTFGSALERNAYRERYGGSIIPT